jgi:sulfur carrier protein
MMNIVMNGKQTHTTEGATLVALLRENQIAENAEGVAIAVNSAVVPRREWSHVHLHDGDSVEVIHAVQGG